MNAPRISLPATAVALCLIAASVIPACVASAQEKEIVLRPGEVWRVYDAQGTEVARITVDDVVEGVDVAQYHTTDPASGQDSEKLSGTLAQVRAAIAAEVAKGIKANRGNFLDPDQINFAVAGTVLAEDLTAVDADDAGPAAPAAPAPSPAEGPPTPGAPGAPGAPAAPAGPPGAEGGPAPSPGPPAEPLEEDGGKGLPLLPILIGAVVLAAVIVIVLKKRGRAGAGAVPQEPPPPAQEPPGNSQDTG